MKVSRLMTARARVLIADDEPGMRRSLADILLEEGYEVEVAEDGPRAADLCDRGPFDVVLIDVRMPGLRGTETFLRIRRHRAQTTIVLISAFDSQDLWRRAVDEGAAIAMPSPLDAAQVLRWIEARHGDLSPIVRIEMSAGDALRAALEAYGHRPIVTRSPREALDLAERRCDDVLLLLRDPPRVAAGGSLVVRSLTAAAVAALCAEDEPSPPAANRVRYAYFRKPLELDRLLALLEAAAGFAGG